VYSEIVVQMPIGVEKALYTAEMFDANLVLVGAVQLQKIALKVLPAVTTTLNSIALKIQNSKTTLPAIHVIHSLY
jgi:hypothetical protein